MLDASQKNKMINTNIYYSNIDLLNCVIKDFFDSIRKNVLTI
jgi:hypothetical protein